MEIELKDGTRQHIANEVGRALIAAGLANEIIPQPKAPKVTFGIHVASMSNIVSLQVNCDACRRRDNFVGPATKDNFAAMQGYICAHAKALGGIPDNVLKAYAEAVRKGASGTFEAAAHTHAHNAPGEFANTRKLSNTEADLADELLEQGIVYSPRG